MEEQVLQKQEGVAYEANNSSNVTWEELRRLLDKVAHPRREWARRLGISYQHFKMLLNGTRKPSGKVAQKILLAIERTQYRGVVE